MKTLIFLLIFYVAGISYASNSSNSNLGCDCETGEGFSNSACKNSCVEKSVSESEAAAAAEEE